MFSKFEMVSKDGIQTLEVQVGHIFDGRSEKIIVVVRIYNKQFPGGL